MSSHLNMPAISAATFASAAAIGASYVYVDLSMNRMGASAAAIGLNASMPALAWLLTTPLLPVLLRRCDPRAVLLALLTIAIASPLGLALFTDWKVWLLLRFLFGGSVGMVFRLIEYWINAASPDHQRGRNVGIYASTFCAGAAVGAGVVPLTGSQGWPPILLIMGLLCAATVALLSARSAPPGISGPPRIPLKSVFASVAVVAALAYGLFEAVPYTMMPVYVLRVGLSEDWAAWTVSAFLTGGLLFPIPMGMIADRMSKTRLLAICAAIALAIPVILPATLSVPEALLFGVFVWGGFAGSLYTVSLALLAERFRSSVDLASANVAFGTLYAAGALVGPPLHGIAMDWHDPQGLMVSSVLLFGLFLGFMVWQRWWEGNRA